MNKTSNLKDFICEEQHIEINERKGNKESQELDRI